MFNEEVRVVKRIVVCTTPRTGSNLLVHSLAEHPLAVSASEWFNETMGGPYALNRRERPEECNLLKLMYYDRNKPGFDAVYRSGFRVFLYRKDRDAQLASWRRACATGLWMAEWEKGEPSKFPVDANEQVDNARRAFRYESHMVLSYEQLVDHWDDAIANILKLAEWPAAKIVKSLRRSTS